MPTEDEVLHAQIDVADHLETEETIVGIDCVYAPDALISLRNRADLPLAQFWTELLDEGLLVTDDERPFAVRALGPQGDKMQFAVLYHGEGFVPPVLDLELIDGNWLIIHMHSDVRCAELPSSIVAELHPNTCA